jgi:hypothetical protein
VAGLVGAGSRAPGSLVITSNTDIISIDGHSGPGGRRRPGRAAVIDGSFWLLPQPETDFDHEFDSGMRAGAWLMLPVMLAWVEG